MTATTATTSRFQQLIQENQAGMSFRRKAINAIMLALTGFMTLLALIPLFWIMGYVIYKGAQYINLDFFIHLPLPLGMDGGGVLNAIQGTLIISGLAALIAIPPAVLAAFYAANYPNTPLGVALRFSTDVLAGVPSVVIGLFAYAVIVKPMGHYSGLAGAIAMAILMLPTVIRTTEEMLKLVPHSLREASLGLGAPEWKTSLRIIFPAAMEGIVTGFLLAIARAAGETAPFFLQPWAMKGTTLDKLSQVALHRNRESFRSSSASSTSRWIHCRLPFGNMPSSPTRNESSNPGRRRLS